jgi:hypothetical protein
MGASDSTGDYGKKPKARLSEVGMASDFLLKEYELCFAQLRFYDKRQESILKYTFSLVSAVATACFAIYKYRQDNQAEFPFDVFAALSCLLFIITLLLFLAALSNRYYFVKTARQVNAIRKHFLEGADKASPPGFGMEENRMWTDSDWPLLSLRSVHTYILFGLAVISSLLAACALYWIDYAEACRWDVVGIGFVVVLAAEIVLGVRQLSEKPPVKPSPTSKSLS